MEIILISFLFISDAFEQDYQFLINQENWPAVHSLAWLPPPTTHKFFFSIS